MFHSLLSELAILGEAFLYGTCPHTPPTRRNISRIKALILFRACFSINFELMSMFILILHTLSCWFIDCLSLIDFVSFNIFEVRIVLSCIQVKICVIQTKKYNSEAKLGFRKTCNFALPRFWCCFCCCLCRNLCTTGEKEGAAAEAAAGAAAAASVSESKFCLTMTEKYFKHYSCVYLHNFSRQQF